MDTLSNIVSAVDDFVWGPVMLVLLVGTGIFLTIRTGFLPWRNLPYALRSVLSKEARTTQRGEGDVSPFAALTTALAATIGTGNIVGVATAMVKGGPGALVWMWISAAFGLTSKFSECMLAIKYRTKNEKGEMLGGPMTTMKHAFKHKTVGAVLAMLFAIFAVIASFGIGNMTQANSISSAITSTFHVPAWITGVVLTVLVLIILIGGIQSISRVSSVLVPAMAVFYVIFGIVVILGNIRNVPAGVVMIFRSAFSWQAVSGGVLGTIVASMMQALRWGVARGVFSNEAGMGSAAITAAAATTDDPVRQGYINMTGTFFDTIVVCTITGLVIAASGVLGLHHTDLSGVYIYQGNTMVVEAQEDGTDMAYTYDVTQEGDKLTLVLQSTTKNGETVSAESKTIKMHRATAGEVNPFDSVVAQGDGIVGTWMNDADNVLYCIGANASFEQKPAVTGSALTISAFETILKRPGGWLVTIAIALFAFSTIIGWEYHGEKALEYIVRKPIYCYIYRVIFALIAYFGATQSLELVWNFSDIANALMAIPNLISLLALSGVIAHEIRRFQPIVEKENAARKKKQ